MFGILKIAKSIV